MKILFSIPVFFFTLFQLTAQELRVDKNNTFMLDSAPLLQKDLKIALKTKPEALKNYRQGRLQYTGAGLLILTGGGLFGAETGRWTAGRDTQWKNFAIGGGLVALGTLVSKGYKKKYKKAVALYNISAKSKPTAVSVRPKGMGLAVRF